MGAILLLVIYFFFGSPKERVLQYENAQLESQYKLLSRRVDDIMVVLDDIKQRDNNLYRVILQADPIADDVRNAGGNTARYDELLRMPDGEFGGIVDEKSRSLVSQLIRAKQFV